MNRAVAMSRTVGIALALSSLSGCHFGTAENLALPGTVGTGDDAVVVKAELPDVGILTKNAQVKVDDIVVGTVTNLQVRDWHAVATLSLKPDTRLPHDVRASVGVNSLLGSAYVELAPTSARSAGGRLANGATIPLANGHAYPSTEQVLSSASLVLNGGGLEQIETITRETNRALGGDNQAFADLLPRLESFVTALNEQQGDIKTTIRALDATAGRYAENRKTITDALDELGPALDALAEERPELTHALKELAKLRRVAVPFIDDVQPALVKDLDNLQPTLRALVKAGPSLVRALAFLITFPFSPDVVTRACPAGYCNLFVTLDLTNQALLDGFRTETGQLELPGFGPLPTTVGAAGSGPARTPAGSSAVTGVPDEVTRILQGVLKPPNSSVQVPKPNPSPSPSKSGGLLGGLIGSLGGNR
jgi:phospholipid/cholesterol/gamma-HCH transport system substrate-binding protein